MTRLDAVYLPLALATAPAWARKKRGGWRERFGHIGPLPPKPPGVPRIMLHAVSVGEVSALRALVPLLTPHAQVLVTAGTDTGLARARDLYGGVAIVARYPLDFSWSVRRFLDAAQPDAVALVELELWPQFIDECARRAIPACIINGRLSERSYRGYSRIRGFMARRLRTLAFAAVQDEEYASRFEALGTPPDACLLTGSMKWDVVSVGGQSAQVDGARELGAALGIDPAQPLVVAGSTAEGEESLLLEAVRRVRAAGGALAGTQLLCAPRKPERFDQAARDLTGCVRRSAPVASGERTNAGLFLLDTIGELRKAYALADVVVMGRTFGQLYGSDPIEPIALGKATIMGPRVADFASIVRAFEQRGGLVRAEASSLADVLARLLSDPQGRARVASAGLACIEEQRGASERHAQLLRALCAQSRTSR